MTKPTAATQQYSLHTRLCVGPRFTRADHPAFWDWSTLNLDAAYTPTPGETTLALALAPGATTLTLSSTVGWPTKGGCWLGGNGTGETWEYVEFTGLSGSTLTGLVRETVTNEQTGVHSAGAVVRFWQILSADENRFTLSENLTGNKSAITVSANFSGFAYLRQVLRNYHLVLVQFAWDNGAGVFDNWTNAMVGWINEPKATDDAEKAAPWQLTLGGSDDILTLLPCKGLRVGPLNLATLSNASASTQLAKPYKEYHAGEFVGTSVSLAPKSAIDEDLDTLYISEVFLGNDDAILCTDITKNYYGMPDLQGAMAGLDQIHITKYTGQPDGYRWFQVHLNPTKSVWPKLANPAGIFPDMTGKAHMTAPRVIVCENLSRFTDENPFISIDPNGQDQSGAQLIELNADTCTLSSGTTADWWNSFVPSGGSVIYNGSTMVAWGSYGGLPALKPGETIVRDYKTGSAGSYYITHASKPGYCMDQWMTSQHYLLAELQPLGLTLANDITASSPGVGDKLYLNSGITPCTSGLASSGSLCFGEEYLAYAGKSSGSMVITARGTGGTAAAAHKKGDTAYVFENGAVTDGWPISSITWRRKAGMPTIKQFWLFGARWPLQPRILGDGYWMNDYDQFGANVTNNTASTYTYTHTGPNKRYRWASLIGERMAAEPYRFMVNEFEVLADPSVYDAHQYLASGTVYQIAREILIGAGFPAGAVVDGGGTPTLSNLTTSTENTWKVLVDLMDLSGCFLETQRDGKLTVRTHSYWNKAVVTEVADWARAGLNRFEFDPARGRTCGQIELEWEALDKTSKGTVHYPANRDDFGEIIKIGPWRYASEAAALTAAQSLYWAHRAPYAITLEIDGAPWDLRPGVIHGASWDFGGESVAYDRSHLLDRVDHRIQDGGFETVAHAIQINRTDET